MSQKPKVSYVLPTKNRLAWMPECLQSLLAQSVPDIEIVVVNDGSTDGTKEWLDGWASKFNKVKVIHNEKSLGGGPSRNIGMKEAKADIIGVCDDDDIYMDNKTSLILDWFDKNPKSELVNFPYVQIGYMNEKIDDFPGMEFDHDLFKETGQITYFCNPSAAYKKKSGMDVGGYPREDEKRTDDYQFVSNWVKKHNKRIDFCDKYFGVMHRVLPTSMMVKHRGFDPRWVTKNGQTSH